jgi:hypothetical protein
VGFVSWFIFWLSPGLIGYQALAGEIPKDQFTVSDVPALSLPLGATPNLEVSQSPTEINSGEAQVLPVETASLLGGEKTVPQEETISLPARAKAHAKTTIDAVLSKERQLKESNPIQSAAQKSKPATGSFNSTTAELRSLEFSSLTISGRFFDGSKSGMPLSSEVHSQSPEISSRNAVLISQLMSHIKDELSSMTVVRGHHAIFKTVSKSSKEFLDVIESDLRSGAINPHAIIRTSSVEPIDAGSHAPIRIGIYPVAADPFHWGHLLIGLQAIARLKLDKVIYVLAGDDPRKPQITPASVRHPLGVSVLNSFSPFYVYSPIAIGTTADGETNLFKLLALNAGRALEAFYLVGDDHYRRKDKNGNDDTILKIEKNKENPASLFDPIHHSIHIAFIERGGKKEEVPSVLPISFMPNIPFEASSSAIRSGDYHLMPYDVYRAIREKGLGLYGIKEVSRNK